MQSFLDMFKVVMRFMYPKSPSANSSCCNMMQLGYIFKYLLPREIQQMNMSCITADVAFNLFHIHLQYHNAVIC